MAGGTLFIKVLPEKGAEKAISAAVERGGQQAEGSGKDSGSRWGLGFAAAAGVAIGRGLQQAAALEQVEVGLTTMLGSASDAKDMMGELTQFARNTPFEMQGLAANARQLLGVGAAAEDVIPTLQVLGDASAALGLSQAQMDRVLTATTQSMAKGKFQAEEMMQMAEAGIPIYDLMARAVGKSVPEMQEMAKEGELLAGDVLPKLLAVMQEDFAGGMVAQSKTLNGVLSTVKDDINLGLAEAVKFLIPVLGDLLPSAAKAATGVIGVFGLGLQAVVTLATPMIQLLDALLEGFGSLPQPIQTGITVALLLGRILGVSLAGFILKFIVIMATSTGAMIANARAAGTLSGALAVLGRTAAGAAGRAGLAGLAGSLGGKWGAAALGIGLVVTGIISIAKQAGEAKERIDALVGDVNFSSRNGASDALKKLREEIASSQEYLERFSNNGKDGDWFSNMFTSADNSIDAAKEKIEELYDAQQAYTRNSKELADGLGITVAQLEALAAAADLDLNLLAGDKDDVAQFVAGLKEANTAVAAGFDPTSRLGQAMAEYGDEAATAKDKTDAFKLALEALAGNQIGVLQATANWKASLAGVVETLTETDDKGRKLALAAVDVAGNIDLASEAGRQLQSDVLGAAEAMRTSAAAARDQAIADGDVAGAARAAGAAAQASRDEFIANAIQAGLTAQQAENLANTYGLIPGDIVTAIITPGMTQAQIAADVLRNKVLAVPDSKTVITSALTAEAVQRLESLGFKVETLPDGTVRVTANTAAAEDAISRLVQTRYMTIIANTVPGSSTRAGDVQNLARQNGLANGGRLEFFAGGGMREYGTSASVRALTPMRGNWAAMVPANTWRVIGDRARGREWYIPEHAPNTLALLRDAASAHGLQLVRAMADGGLLGGRPTAGAPVTAGRVTNIQNTLNAAPSLPAIDQLQRMQREAEVLADA